MNKRTLMMLAARDSETKRKERDEWQRRYHRMPEGEYYPTYGTMPIDPYAGRPYTNYPRDNYRDGIHGRRYQDDMRPPIKMSRIGFETPMEDDPGRYRSDTGYRPSMETSSRHGEMDRMPRTPSMLAASELDTGTAMTWVKEMENCDGTRGAHWDLNQTESLLKTKGWKLDPTEFYVAINMIYSDYCTVAKRFNVSNPDFYAEMAKAFLEDKDAGAENKLAGYYYGVVQG